MLRTSALQCRLQGIVRHARGLKSPSAIGMAQMVSISVMVCIKDYLTGTQMALLTHRGKNWRDRERERGKERWRDRETQRERETEREKEEALSPPTLF